MEHTKKLILKYLGAGKLSIEEIVRLLFCPRSQTVAAVYELKRENRITYRPEIGGYYERK